MNDSYSQLLSWYSEYLRRAGYLEVAALALRTSSFSLRDVISYIATYDTFTTSQVKERLYEGSLANMPIRPAWLLTLGRIIALQAFQASDIRQHETDIEFGLRLLEYANPFVPNDRVHSHFHRLETELLARQGRLDEAKHKVEAEPQLASLYYGYLLSDLYNPLVTGTHETYATWLSGFNKPFFDNGLALIDVEPRGRPSFDKISVQLPPTAVQNREPLVTVIMTSYKPELKEFLHSVDSILNQTWKNIELLVVDDASPAQYWAVLETVQNRDDRVRLVQLSQNGGTYRARNEAIALARGFYITGQDSDDWSHPERLEEQVEFLQTNPHSQGVVVEAIRMNNDLIRTFPGRLPQRLCEVSLMLRTDLAKEIGGYIDARKGADSEFRRRIERFTGQQIDLVQKPLYLTRIGHDSLSAADFKPGWSHPVRRAFWNSSQHWHEGTHINALRLKDGSTSPIPIPSKFKVHRSNSPSEFDALFVNDWRSYGASQRSMIDEINALRLAGQSVAIMQLESVLSPSKEHTRLSKEIQELINNGLVTEVIPDEGARAKIVLITDPSILQFVSTRRVDLEAGMTLIAPDFAPFPTVGSFPLYLPDQCDQRAAEIFGGSVLWTAKDPKIYKQLSEWWPDISMASELSPISFDSAKWKHNRLKLCNDPPIIGRHSENLEELWPNDLENLGSLWPSEGEIEIRIIGDARGLLRKQHKSRYPASWIVFRDGDIRPEAFMSSLDFFVYFPAEGYQQSYCREAMEAAASGAIVILPEEFAPLHGDSAIYPEPHQVPALIESFLSLPGKYRTRSLLGESIVRHGSNQEAYVDFVKSVLTSNEKANTKGE